MFNSIAFMQMNFIQNQVNKVILPMPVIKYQELFESYKIGGIQYMDAIYSHLCNKIETT